jgi:hypothetical protein
MLAIFISDPFEEELPDVGRAVFAAGQAHIEIDTSTPGFRRRFSEERRAWRSTLAALSRRRAIPVLPISTERDVADQLRDLIGRRGGRLR